MAKIKHFNVPFDERSKIPMYKQNVVLTYDISDNKRRRKFIKILNEYGSRVQKSVFEFSITRSALRELQSKIDRFYDEEKGDQIRLYKFKGEVDAVIYGDIELVDSEEILFI